MRYFPFIIPLAFLFCACNPEKIITDSSESAAYANVEFGNDALQKMDIFLPAGRRISTTKTIVIIHGGAWTSGDKSEMTSVVDSLKIRLPNYAFINLNYRLAVNNSVNIFPTQENDVKTAIEFYLGKSLTYEVSKDIIVLGASAGAHLAMLHSYKNDPERHVKAVVDLFGPTDLVAEWNEGFLQQLALMAATGKTYEQDPAIYTQSSPVNFINAQSPPTIALQGGIDYVVSPNQTNLVIAKLNSMGVTSQLVVYPNEGHGFSQANNTDALNKVMAFISKNVK